MAFSPLCQLSRGCMGCCGHDFISKAKIKDAIRKNTQEFKAFNPQTEQEYLAFRDRRPAMDLYNGVCRNLIEEHGWFICPLHPALHEGKDLRLGHCDINYFCRTAQEFMAWNDGQKKRFFQFIKSKKRSNIDYSLKMENGSLLKEFKG